MRRGTSRALSVLRLLVSAALVGWLVARTGPDRLADALAGSNTAFLLLAAASIVPSIGIRALSLHVVTNKDGVVLRYPQAFGLTLVGVTSSLFLPPGIADLTRAHLGYRAFGRPERMVTASLLDRATSLVALGALGAVAAALAGSYAIAAAAAVVALLVTILVLVPGRLPWQPLVRLLARGAEVDRAHLAQALQVRPALLFALFGISAAGWISTALTTLLICRALAVGVAVAPIVLATLLAAVSRLVPVSAAGVGVGEWTLSLALTRFGVSPGAAASVALVALVLGVIAPGIAGFFVRFRERENAGSETVGAAAGTAVGAAPVPPTADVAGAAGIRRLQPADAAAAATLHRDRLSHSLVDRMGRGLLECYYETFAAEPQTLAFAATDNSALLGIAVGAPDGYSVYRAIARRHPLAAVAGTVRLLAAAPARGIRGLRSAAGKSPSTGPVPAIVLHVLAVRRDAEGTGVGRELLDTFLAAAREAGAAEVRVIADRDDNDRTRAFYERAGFRQAAVTDESADRPTVEYRRELSGSPRAPQWVE